MAATYRGSSVTEANSGTVSWPSGTAAGDSAVIKLFGNGSLTLTASGWTQDVTVAQINDQGSNWSAWRKASLSSGEVSSPPTYSGCDFGGIEIYVAQGASGVSFITNTANVAAGTNSLTGFTKDANSSLILTTVIDRTSAAPTIVQPSGFTDRGQTVTTFFTCDQADIASSGYTNSASVAWTGLQADSASGAGLWEFTAGSHTDYTLPVDAGSFTLTGQAVAFHVSRNMPAAAGSFSLSGQTVALRDTHKMPAGTGSFVISGQDVILSVAHKMPAAAATFAFTGQAVGLRRDYTVGIGAGSFSLAGQAVALRWTHAMPAAAAAFALTGQNVGLHHDYTMAASAGIYALTGQAVAMRHTSFLPAETGVFAVTGRQVTLTASAQQTPTSVLFRGMLINVGEMGVLQE